MATAYTREWIQFFTGCGIPDDVAAMYALIFCENRIQKNMLMDLNKEYLRDMGITVMGDVIAILKHAKIIHEKSMKAQILSIEDHIVLEQKQALIESSPDVKKTTPVKRMLEHYTRNYNSGELNCVDEVQVIVSNDKVKSLLTKEGNEIVKQKPIKKKIQISNTDLDDKRLEVPVPKVRRVLPENEGRYKIKMPSGTTERSKKLLEQAKKRKAKTVFDRLGESSVSSTTSEISTSSSSTNSVNKSSSVFSRLGEKTSVVSSTSSIDDSETISSNQLPYAGILKGNPNKKDLPSSTMRADKQQQSEVNKVKKKISVKKRLGVSQPEEEEEAQQKKPMLKAVRRLNTESPVAKTTIKLTNKRTSIQLGPTVGNKSFKADELEIKRKTLAQKPTMLSLKRKIESDLDTNPSKKVRFGRTTHILIPSNQTNAESFNNVKNYPKLTMIIKNKGSLVENVAAGKSGSLTSDNLSGRIGVKARIGNKSMQARLGKRAPIQNGTRRNNITTVKDRLG